MAITSFPFEAQSTTEAQYTTIMREAQDAGVCADITASDLLCAPKPATTLQSQIQPGTCLIRGIAMVNTAIEVVTHAPVTAGSQRIDSIVAHLSLADNSIVPLVVAGSTTDAPILTQNATVYQMKLADVVVSTSGAVSVLDRRTFVGQRFGVWSTLTRPLAPRSGQIGYNTDLATNEQWVNGVWSPLLGEDTTLALTLLTGYKFGGSDASNDPRPSLRKYRGLVHLQGLVMPNTGNFPPNSTFNLATITADPSYLPKYKINRPLTAASGATVRGIVTPGGTIAIGTGGISSAWIDLSNLGPYIAQTEWPAS